MKDCVACWPLLNPGGIMLVDDMSFADVGPAVRAFIAEREAAGETVHWQLHQNERDMMLIRKGA
jgi:predicted O-methyltransferase YrrM